MLSFRVIQAQHARRDLVSSPGPVCSCHPSSPNSHGIISFADPHLLNPVMSYRYKNVSATGPQNSSLITRHCSQLLSYHNLAHYFASRKKSTPLFSAASALFVQNHPGWVPPKFQPKLSAIVEREVPTGRDHPSHCRQTPLVPQSAKARDFFTIRGNKSALLGV
jgi:hypothetical protein